MITIEAVVLEMNLRLLKIWKSGPEVVIWNRYFRAFEGVLKSESSQMEK